MRVVAFAAYEAPAITVHLRALTGRDELAVTPGDPAAAITLLRRLARRPDGGTLDPGLLTVPRADRLLAAIHDMLYGPRAECRVRCAACRQPYEFTLVPDELIAAQDAARPPPPEADGAWTLDDGRRVRAPRLDDVAAANGPAALLATLVVSGDPTVAPDVINAFLENAAPSLALDLDAPCPHCASPQTARFDMARYLAQRLAAERPFLLREAHLIASRYGWSHAEIVDLTRADRRAFAGMIEAERASLQRRRAV